MDKPDLRHEELRAMMRYKGIAQTRVAALMGISQVALTKKLSGDIRWTLEDVYRIGLILSIPTNELLNYFPRPF